MHNLYKHTNRVHIGGSTQPVNIIIQSECFSVGDATGDQPSLLHNQSLCFSTARISMAWPHARRDCCLAICKKLPRSASSTDWRCQCRREAERSDRCFRLAFQVGTKDVPW